MGSLRTVWVLILQGPATAIPLVWRVHFLALSNTTTHPQKWLLHQCHYFRVYSPQGPCFPLQSPFGHLVPDFFYLFDQYSQLLLLSQHLTTLIPTRLKPTHHAKYPKQWQDLAPSLGVLHWYGAVGSMDTILFGSFPGVGTFLCMLLQLVLARNICAVALERWQQDSFVAYHREGLDISQRSSDIQVLHPKNHHRLPKAASPLYASLENARPPQWCTFHLCTCHWQNLQKQQFYYTCCIHKINLIDFVWGEPTSTIGY